MPGREVAGTVDTVGEGADPEWLGTRVSAHLGPTGSGALGMRRLAEDALDLLADGTFAPVTTRFPLADAAGAHRALEERRTEGKVVPAP